MVFDEDPLWLIQLKTDKHVRKLGPLIVRESVGVSHINFFLLHVCSRLARRVTKVDCAFTEDHNQETGQQQDFT